MFYKKPFIELRITVLYYLQHSKDTFILKQNYKILKNEPEAIIDKIAI